MMMLMVFFFRHKTAYEVRISDWSSDVCSSDLLFADRALADAGGFLEAAEDQEAAALVIVDIGLLHIGVDRRFLRGAEAAAHVDALGAQAERGDEAAAVAEAARGEHRDLHLVGRRGDQDQPRDIILAGMARAFRSEEPTTELQPLIRRPHADIS